VTLVYDGRVAATAVTGRRRASTTNDELNNRSPCRTAHHFVDELEIGINHRINNRPLTSQQFAAR
jgi:hypothetical protein